MVVALQTRTDRGRCACLLACSLLGIPLGSASAQPTEEHGTGAARASEQLRQAEARQSEVRDREASRPSVRQLEARYSEARQRVDRAKQLFQVRNYEAARVEFTRAYELLEGHARQYVVLYNRAVCAERLFRYDEALQLYEQYLREGGPDAADRSVVQEIIASLKRLLAELVVDTNVPAELWLDDRPFGNTPSRVRVAGGRHVIEVRALLHESARKELLLDAGSQLRLHFDLNPLSSYRGLKRGLFTGSAVATGALLLAGGIFGALTLFERGRGNEHAEQVMGLRTAELDADRARVQNWALATDLTLAGGAVFGLSTVLLYALTDWE